LHPAPLVLSPLSLHDALPICGDRFLNMFAALARTFPVLPLAGAKTRFQPVYVEDVAEVMWRCLIEPDSAGQIYALAGPTTYSLRDRKSTRLNSSHVKISYAVF